MYRFQELIELKKVRDKIFEEADNYEDLNNLTRDKIRILYKDVIPLVSSNAKIPNIKITGHVVNFRFLAMEEIIDKQNKVIEDQGKLIKEQGSIIQE